jgi:hypothetical protein
MVRQSFPNAGCNVQVPKINAKFREAQSIYGLRIQGEIVNYIILCRPQRMPESLRAFCRIVSFTAAKTSRMLDVSVACVKLKISDELVCLEG